MARFTHSSLLIPPGGRRNGLHDSVMNDDEDVVVHKGAAIQDLVTSPRIEQYIRPLVVTRAIVLTLASTCTIRFIDDSHSETVCSLQTRVDPLPLQWLLWSLWQTRVIEW